MLLCIVVVLLLSEFSEFVFGADASVCATVIVQVNICYMLAYYMIWVYACVCACVRVCVCVCGWVWVWVYSC